MTENVPAVPMGRTARIVLHVVIAANLLLSYGIRFVTPPIVATSLLGTLAVICAVSAYLLVIRARFVPVILFVAAIIVIVVQVNAFTWTTGLAPNYSTGFQFVAPLSFIYFCTFRKPEEFEYAIGLLVRYGLVYVFLHVLLSIAVLSHAIDGAFLGRLLIHQPDRPDRLAIDPYSVLMVAFAYLRRESGRSRLVDYVIVLVAVVDLYLANTRTATIAALAIAVLSPWFRPRAISMLSMAAFIALIVPLVAGLFAPGWSLYQLFGADTSAVARDSSFGVAASLIFQNPILGLGLPATPEALVWYTGDPYFFTSDLGVVGVWVELGLFGLLLYLGAVVAAASFPLSRLTNPRLGVPLLFTGCVLAISSAQTPYIFYGGALILPIILAARLVLPRVTDDEPQTAEHIVSRRPGYAR